MSEGLKVPYSKAAIIADNLVEMLGVHFDRLEIAGSLRRQKDMIGDIELVGIPHSVQDGLFGFEKISPTGMIIDLMRLMGYKAEKAGEKYIKFVSDGKMNVDLIMCTPKTWGCIFMIRTGSAEFTRKMVTKKSFRGWCPDSMQFCDGHLWWEGLPLETPEEEDVFREMAIPYVLPEERELR